MTKNEIDKEWIFEIIDKTNAFAKQLITDHFELHEAIEQPSDESGMFMITEDGPEPIEQPQPEIKSAEEILEPYKKYHYSPQDGGIPDLIYIKIKDALKAMKQYRNQGILEITDEEIKEWAMSSSDCADEADGKYQGAKWYREHIKSKQ